MKAERPKGCICLKVAAEILAKRGVGTDERRIYAQLRKLGFLEGLRASEEALRAGWLEEAEGSFSYAEGGDGSYMRAFLTGAGIAELARRLPRAWRPDVSVELGVANKCVLGC